MGQDSNLAPISRSGCSPARTTTPTLGWYISASFNNSHQVRDTLRTRTDMLLTLPLTPSPEHRQTRTRSPVLQPTPWDLESFQNQPPGIRHSRGHLTCTIHHARTSCRSDRCNRGASCISRVTAIPPWGKEATAASGGPLPSSWFLSCSDSLPDCGSQRGHHTRKAAAAARQVFPLSLVDLARVL
jgi:hypothetical protein